MKLQFKIDKTYLLVHSLNASQNLPFHAWEHIKDQIWNKSKETYFLINGYSEFILFIINQNKMKETYKKINCLTKELFKTKEFKKLYRETNNYLKTLKKQWGGNKKQALKILEELLGLPLPNKTITVLVTHPKLKNGFNIPDLNTICWGHPEEWKNYSTVYLCHEMMHIIIKDYQNDNIMHALIELMTDNELRIRLNKRGKYFKQGKFEVGHPYLRKLEKKMFPYWIKYLKKENKKTLFDLEKELCLKLKVKK